MSGKSIQQSIFWEAAIASTVDMVVTEVWQALWQGAEEETPRLRMRRPGSMPSGAGFIYFYDADGVSRSETGGKAHIVYKFRGTRGVAMSTPSLGVLLKLN